MTKSPGGAFTLSLLFGPIGSIYAGLGYAVKHLLVLLAAFLLLTYILWVSPDIGKNENFAGAVIIAGLVLWFLLAVGAMRSVSFGNEVETDDKVDEERRNQEILMAIRDNKKISTWDIERP